MTQFAINAISKRADHRGSTALRKLIEKSTGFGALSLWVKYEDSVMEKDPAPAWTTGKKVVFGKAYEKFTLKEQVGVAAHELFHVAFRHVQRGQALRKGISGFDGKLFNIAIDGIVNQSLAGFDWLALPGQCVVLTELLRNSLGIEQSPDEALATWSAESLYRALHDKEGAKEKAYRYAESKGFEGDMDLDAEPTGANSEDSSTKEDREWRDRLVRARAGESTAGILRRLLADLPKTTTPWEHVLRSKLTRALMPESEETWNRPSRRYMALTSPDPNGEIWEMPYEQGIAFDKPAMKLAVMIDTSGSIDEKLFERFCAEIVSIQAKTGAT